MTILDNILCELKILPNPLNFLAPLGPTVLRNHMLSLALFVISLDVRGKNPPWRQRYAAERKRHISAPPCAPHTPESPRSGHPKPAGSSFSSCGNPRSNR